MKSYTTLRNLYDDLTNDDSSTNLTLGDQLMNDEHRRLVKKFRLNEVTATDTTVASTQAYNLPYNCSQLMSWYLTVGTTRYFPKEAPNRAFWDRLNQTTSVTSDTPEWFYIQNKQILLYPKSTTAAYTMTFVYKKRIKDLSLADYTTGTIITTVVGDETIVGSSTVWTAKMAGLWLRITDSLTANTGDGEWYEIASVTDATNLELRSKYAGTAITAGSAAYTIGQMPELPEDYHLILPHRAAMEYFASIKPDANRFKMHREIYTELYNGLIADFSSKTDNPVVESENLGEQNPNLYKQI